MASKTLDIPEIGKVTVTKRRNARSLRIKLTADGAVQATIPTYIPYMAAKTYILSHKQWINEEREKRTRLLKDGQKIGRLHTLSFVHDENHATPKARVASSRVIVRHSGRADSTDVQQAAKRAAIRALKLQARHFLPKRLRDIANREGYSYSKVTIKQLKSRWGSCNQHQEITLNIFLMELPIELIDYVILHELAHTRHLHHGRAFWDEMNEHTDNQAKELRKQMKQFQPTIPARSVA